MKPSYGAWYLNFDSGGLAMSFDSRYYGFPVRGGCEWFFLITKLILRDYRGCSCTPFFVPYIEIINIYILLFIKIIERHYAKYSLQINTKPSSCNIVKYSSLLCFKAFLSSLSYHFDSAGIVTLLKGENRSQQKSESLDEYLGRFRHKGCKLPLYIFVVVVGGSYFSWGRRFLFSRQSFSPPSPPFSF